MSSYRFCIVFITIKLTTMTGEQLLLVFCLMACALAKIQKLYVGTWSNAIYIVDFDNATGSIKLSSSINVGSRPSYVILDPSNTILYTVNEVTDFQHLDKTGGVLSYKIKQDG